jgi:hypothetical protein
MSSWVRRWEARLKRDPDVKITPEAMVRRDDDYRGYSPTPRVHSSGGYLSGDTLNPQPSTLNPQP